MRPTDKPTGAVWRVLEAWQERQRQADKFGRAPSQGDMAQLFGVSDSLVGDWKYMRSRMQPDEMKRIEDETDIAASDLAAALQEDLPTINANVAARRTPDGANRRQRRKLTALPGSHDEDLDALPSEADDPAPIRGRALSEAARREDQDSSERS